MMMMMMMMTVCCLLQDFNENFSSALRCELVLGASQVKAAQSVVFIYSSVVSLFKSRSVDIIYFSYFRQIP